MREIVESIPVFIPVRTISLTNEAEEEHVSGSVPAREFMELFDLRVDLPSWRTADQAGVVLRSTWRHTVRVQTNAVWGRNRSSDGGT